MLKQHNCDKAERIEVLEKELESNRAVIELGKYLIDVLFSRKVLWFVFLISFIFNLLKGG